AEDGIRDLTVTGVQTCALPISGLQGAGWPQMSPGLFGQPGTYAGYVPFAHEPALTGMYPSSYLQTPFAPSPFAPSPFAASPFAEIGRASCRERVECWVGGRVVK